MPIHFRPRAAAAIGASLLMVAAACSSTEPDVAVVPPDHDESQALLADDSSYANAVGDGLRHTADGLTLETSVEYFEGVRFGEWSAPDECSYNTRVRIGLANYTIAVASEPFDGPTSSTDDSTSGWVGGLAPIPGWAYLGPDLDAVAVDPETPEGMEPLEPLVAAVVAVFGHQRVVSLRLADPGAEFSARGRTFSPVDTQPLDGWATLAVLLPASEIERAGLPALELEWVDPDGMSTVEPVVLAETFRPADETAGGELAAEGYLLDVMQPDWVFDIGDVGDQCVPPVVDSDPDNEVAAPDADIFSQPIANPPPLPEPGELPSDPTSATADALAAIRATYDLSTPWDDEKAKYSEEPDISREIFRAVRENNLLAPYMSNLDPVFGSLVFTSPTTASVVYRVGPSYQWEIGRVLLIDGTWRTAIGTICRDLAAAVYTCPPDVEIDPPPGPLG